MLVAPEITSMRSIIAGLMLLSWREPSREPVSGTPSIITCTVRPRMVMP